MDKPWRHLTIINETAGSYSRWETEEIRRILNESENLEGRVASTFSVQELNAILRGYQESPPDILGFGGGDDTASCVLTAVKKIWGRIPDYVAHYAMGKVNNLPALLDLSDGLTDKLKKRLHIHSTKAIQLARYISKRSSLAQDPLTEKIELLDVNGRKCFNVGFGVVPKLMWTYFGKSVEEYQQLEDRLRVTSTTEHQRLINEAFYSHHDSGLIRNSGAVYAISTALRTIFSSINPRSSRNGFYQQPLDGEVLIDGELVEIPSLNGIYISSYGQLNFGVKGVTLTISPGAREDGENKSEKATKSVTENATERTMEVVLCPETVWGVVKQLPKLARGERLDNLHYVQAGKVTVRNLQPILCTVEDAFLVANEFTVRYDQTLNFISGHKTCRKVFNDDKKGGF